MASALNSRSHSFAIVLLVGLHEGIVAKDDCGTSLDSCDSTTLAQMSLSREVKDSETRKVPNTIPNTIWVTGKWGATSAEAAKMALNLNDTNLLALKHQESLTATSRIKQWAPAGTRVYYFTDDDMLKSAHQISQMLEEQTSISSSAYNAYVNLRPGAFRADLWRLMILWAYGGVYLDSNLKLTQKLETWIDFAKDELVLVGDAGAKAPAYWNAMMAVAPRSSYMASAIEHIVNNIHNHYYGDNCLAVTGPIALYNALEKDAKGYKDRMRLELSWKDNKVINANGEVFAVKDEGLHDMRKTVHYSDMWRGKHIYCDEKAPEDTLGLCTGTADSETDAKGQTPTLFLRSTPEQD